jgi:hypothetical protein
MKRILALTASLLLVAAPALAQEPPNSVPPQGTVGIVVLLSDGTSYLPVGTAVLASIECGPR